MEVESNSLYVQHCSKQTSKSVHRWYYYCNRGGNYKPKGEGKRSLKMQGSNKIGFNCTAHIKVVQDTTSGVVNVNFCPSHNHSITLGHVPMSEDTRMLVAHKLKDGVTIEKILDDIRDEVGSSFKRHHLVNRQDINNIKRQFNIEGIERHKEDQLSICAWVTELQSLQYDPVTVFKPQGKETDGLIGKDDFLLGIQTRFQCEMMKLYGNKVICMDATHGTNHYHFKLVTVIILDDFGEGVPVGWMISNKEDGVTLKEFLRSLLKHTGPITTDYFMSDDAEQYYSSWKEVYGSQAKKLLCTWHVDKAWRSNLQTISSIEKKTEVYCCLRTILQTLNVADFRKTMQQAISWMLSDPDLEEFGKYFQTYYSKRCEQWAYCHRVGTPVNTNMSVEAFHRLLKVVYLEGKHNRRLDHLLSVLLRIARDKVFDRLIKSEKGKSTHRLGEINRRHHSAVELQKTNSINVEQIEQSSWKVSSASLSHTHYFVRRVSLECNCKVRCASCSVCVHMYTCSCVDNAVHSTACKHIHVVHMSYCERPNTSLSHQTVAACASVSTSRDEIQTLELTQTLQQTKPSDGKIDKLKQKFSGMLSKLESLADESTDCDMIEAGMTHLTSALGIMNTLKRTRSIDKLIPSTTVFPNTNHECQPRFHSTKKRRVSDDKKGMSKPTATQMAECKSKLSETSDSIEVCAVCFQKEDKDADSSNDCINWIQCSQCLLWLHVTCTDLDISTSLPHAFLCVYCTRATTT